MTKKNQKISCFFREIALIVTVSDTYKIVDPLPGILRLIFQSIMGSNPNSGSIQVPFFDGTYEGKRNKLGLRSRVFGNNSSLDTSPNYSAYSTVTL
ncbi:MAG: hypothetical protein PHQ41_08140, partial [Candidatus Cloacimonetes bacterium]|nr:hypothetical protein [Candidatus Cloacimonadota bacterium]